MRIGVEAGLDAGVAGDEPLFTGANWEAALAPMETGLAGSDLTAGAGWANGCAAETVNPETNPRIRQTNGDRTLPAP